MTSDTDTVVLVERALDQTAAIIAAIPGGQAGLATPCPDWNVQALVRHLAGQDLRNFLVAAAVPPRIGRRRPTSSARTGPPNSGTAPPS